MGGRRHAAARRAPPVGRPTGCRTHGYATSCTAPGGERPPCAVGAVRSPGGAGPGVAPGGGPGRLTGGGARDKDAGAGPVPTVRRGEMINREPPRRAVCGGSRCECHGMRGGRAPAIRGPSDSPPVFGPVREPGWRSPFREKHGGAGSADLSPIPPLTAHRGAPPHAWAGSERVGDGTANRYGRQGTCHRRDLFIRPAVRRGTSPVTAPRRAPRTSSRTPTPLPQGGAGPRAAARAGRPRPHAPHRAEPRHSGAGEDTNGREGPWTAGYTTRRGAEAPPRARARLEPPHHAPQMHTPRRERLTADLDLPPSPTLSLYRPPRLDGVPPKQAGTR